MESKITLKPTFYIMQIYHVGGSYQIKKLDANPDGGFDSQLKARIAMFKMQREGNWELNQKYFYSFTIMETFTPKAINQKQM